jgi:hypothetical protein
MAVRNICLMQALRCTAKLRKEMGIKPRQLYNDDLPTKLLGQWHANLLHIRHRKCLLFVNDKSLFNFIVPGVKRKQIQDIGVLFSRGLSESLSFEGFSEPEKVQILEEYSSIVVGKSNNKSVIASMNDIAYHYKIQLNTSEAENFEDLPEIIMDLNRMPLGAIEQIFSIDQLKSVLKSRS